MSKFVKFGVPIIIYSVIVAYAIWPIDALPGWLDDSVLATIGVAVDWIIRISAKKKEKAEQNGVLNGEDIKNIVNR